MVSEAAEHTSSGYIVPPLWGPQTFYMLFRGLKENALSKNHFFCNLFYVQLCTDWTTVFGEFHRSHILSVIVHWSVDQSHFNCHKLFILNQHVHVGAVLNVIYIA